MTGSDEHGIEAARRQALEALAGRDLLSAELESRLMRSGGATAAAATVLAELRGSGLLDDHRVALDRVRRWRRDGRSDADIRARLSTAGLDDHAIDTVLARAVAAASDSPDADRDPGLPPELPPELAAAVTAVGRRGRGLDLSRPDAVRSLAARLARAGFDADTVRAALRHCGIDDAPLDETTD